MYVLFGAMLAALLFGGIVLIDRYFSKKAAKRKVFAAEDGTFTAPVGGNYRITVGGAGSGGSTGIERPRGVSVAHEWFDDDVPLIKKPKSKKKKKKSKKSAKKK